jgi:prepilin-type N-terminal cleavage/methylation domain-containing protein
MRRSRVGDADHQSGFTLIELLVAFFVLAIILAAAASSLISFSRAAVDNERRVQATALLNRLHEELQALPWQLSALYDEDVAAVTWPADLDASGGTFEGADLVTLTGPGADPRIPSIPLPFEVVTIDGRDYEVYRIISWADRDGAGDEDLKRFTTVVRWQVIGQTKEQRFDSERAPTPVEFGEGTPSVTFIVTPEVPLSVSGYNDLGDGQGDGENALPITVFGDFETVGGVDSASVVYEAIDAGVAVQRTLALTRNPGTESFAGEIAPGGDRFAVGSQSFTLVGLVGGTELQTRATVTFLEPSIVIDPPSVRTPVTVTASHPSSLRVGVNAGQPNRLCSGITVTATVDDLEPDGTVTMTYAGSAGTISSELEPVTTITGTADVFSATIPRYSASPWIRPSSVPGNSPYAYTVQFTVTAANPGDPPATSAPVTSSSISISTPGNQTSCG